MHTRPRWTPSFTCQLKPDSRGKQTLHPAAHRLQLAAECCRSRCCGGGRGGDCQGLKCIHHLLPGLPLEFFHFVMPRVESTHRHENPAETRLSHPERVSVERQLLELTLECPRLFLAAAKM